MLKSRHLLQVKRLNIFYYGAFMKFTCTHIEKCFPTQFSNIQFPNQLGQLRASTPPPDEIRKEK